MKTDVASPLLPVETAQNEAIGPFSTLGIVADLCIHHGDYCQFSIDDIMSRVLPALQAGQAQIVFDPQNRPIGFASWLIADDALHERLLQNPLATTVINAPSFDSSSKPQHLWFVDLVTPFSSPLSVLRSLRKSLASFPNAWALAGNNSDGYAKPRRIW